MFPFFEKEGCNRRFFCNACASMATHMPMESIRRQDCEISLSPLEAGGVSLERFIQGLARIEQIVELGFVRTMRVLQFLERTVYRTNATAAA